MSGRGIHETRVITCLSGGKVATHGELVAHGIPPVVIHRLVKKDVLIRRARGYYGLADDFECDVMPLLAARFGGKPDNPRGVICLRAAAQIHGLTDMDMHQIGKIEIAISRSVNATTADMPVRIVRLREPHGEHDMEWRMFGDNGIHVTTPTRTVCDLFAPWSGNLAEGMAREALGRLMATDAGAAREAMLRASRLGWGGRVSEAYEAMMVLRKFSELQEEDLGTGGMRL